MPRLPVPRQFEHVAMADEVRPDVRLRIFEAVTHPGLRPEVDDAVDVDAARGAFQCFGVGEIDALEAELVAELLLQLRQPRLLQLRVVIVIEAVDPDDLVAALEQGARCRRSDKPRSSRDQNRHGGFLGAAVRSAMALQVTERSAIGSVPDR